MRDREGRQARCFRLGGTQRRTSGRYELFSEPNSANLVETVPVLLRQSTSHDVMAKRSAPMPTSHFSPATPPPCREPTDLEVVNSVNRCSRFKFERVL